MIYDHASIQDPAAKDPVCTYPMRELHMVWVPPDAIEAPDANGM